MLSGGAKIHTGKIIFCKLLFTNLFPQATDESEASEEEVENQLRKMDRVWTAHCACAMLLTTSRLFIFWSGFFPINKNLYLLLCNKRERNVPILYTFSVWLSIKTGVLLFLVLLLPILLYSFESIDVKKCHFHQTKNLKSKENLHELHNFSTKSY